MRAVLSRRVHGEDTTEVTTHTVLTCDDDKHARRVEASLNLPANQVLALFNKAMRKIHSFLKGQSVKAVEATMPRIQEVTMVPHAVGLDEDLEGIAKEVTDDMKKKQQALMSALGDIEQYAINSTEGEWSSVLDGKTPKTGMVSIKGKKTPVKGDEPATPKTDSKKRKEGDKGGSYKGGGGPKSSAKKPKTPKKD
jgi:N-acetyltransferase 10